MKFLGDTNRVTPLFPPLLQAVRKKTVPSEDHWVLLFHINNFLGVEKERERGAQKCEEGGRVCESWMENSHGLMIS